MKAIRWRGNSFNIRRINWLTFATFLGVLVVYTSGSADAQRRQGESRNAKNSGAIDLCRSEAAARLKYEKTVKWMDLALEEETGVYLVAGSRDAKPPKGEVATQQYTCRVQKTSAGWKLGMIQLFKEHTKSGKNVFETYR